MRRNINYESPLIEIMGVEVEKGFATSSVDDGNLIAPSLPGGDDIFDIL